MATKIDAGTASDPRFKPEWQSRDEGVPVARYTSQEFADLEAEKLWPHMWQMACRTEEVARPGDYTVYEILDQSILIIRQADNTIKAYHNVCPHRATALAVGSGRFSTGEITCPFHGWRWNLEGDNTFVLDRDEFKGGCLSDEDVKLKECQVATWIGCVFINMDQNAGSFDDHIAPIREKIDPLGLEDMQFYWWKSFTVPANWKVTQEAFHEAYHVPQTHPQLYHKEEGMENYTAIYNYFGRGNGHGYFNVDSGGLNADLSTQRTLTREEEIDELLFTQGQLESGLDAMVLMEEVNLVNSLRHRDIPEDKNMYEALVEVIYAHYENQGRPIGDPAALADCVDAHIFPNYTFLPVWGNCLIYRSRPLANNDPNWCQFELWSVKSYPEGETAPRPKKEICDVANTDDVRLIPRQDFSNIPRMQQGFHSKGIEHTLLADHEEVIIRNHHQYLDTLLMK